MVAAHNSQELLKQRIIIAQASNDTVGDGFVPRKIQRQLCESDDVGKLLGPLFGIAPAQFRSEMTARECLSNERHGRLDALQCDRHPFSGDRIQEPRTISNKEESGAMARLDRKPQRSHSKDPTDQFTSRSSLPEPLS